MKRSLEEYIIEGIKTTIPFHIKLMDDKRFISGKFDTSFMEDFVMGDENEGDDK
jgi:acetyl-CoA carboxylase biotin carboxylase subunit